MKTFKLDEHSKIKTGFTTPANYFEELPEQITKRIENEPKVVTFFSRHKKWFYAAAAVLLIGMFVPIYMNYLEKDKREELIAIENYIDNETELSHYDLINEIPNTVIDDFENELNDI
jgi:hypothetical protein